MDNQNNKQENEKKNYVCTSCDSKSEEEAGTCCGAERKSETKKVGKCEMCGHEKKSDETADCGCK